MTLFTNTFHEDLSRSPARASAVQLFFKGVRKSCRNGVRKGCREGGRKGGRKCAREGLWPHGGTKER